MERRGNGGSRSENGERELKPDHRDWQSVREWENTACAQVEAEGRTEGGYTFSLVQSLEVVRDTQAYRKTRGREREKERKNKKKEGMKEQEEGREREKLRKEKKKKEKNKKITKKMMETDLKRESEDCVISSRFSLLRESDVEKSLVGFFWSVCRLYMFTGKRV